MVRMRSAGASRIDCKRAAPLQMATADVGGHVRVPWAVPCSVELPIGTSPNVKSLTHILMRLLTSRPIHKQLSRENENKAAHNTQHSSQLCGCAHSLMTQKLHEKKLASEMDRIGS